MIENLPPRPSRGDPRLAPLLRELQGNILRGHGRPHAAFVLLRFTAPARAARRWVSAFGGWVETAAVQYAGGNAYLAPGAAPFHALYLSAAGYRHLQIDPALWPADPAFRAGMAAAGPRLGDPPPSDWQPGLAPGVQAVLLVAHAERAALDVALARIVASLGGVAEWQVEHGHANQRQQRGGLLPSYRFVEHFGFADGRSQPLFFAEDLADDAEDEPGGDAVFDPAAPLSQVLVPDAIGGPGAFGSYVVWRKLEQDVRGLHRTLRALAASHPAARGDAARAGALMVGRWPDGTPLPLADAPGLVVARTVAMLVNEAADAVQQGVCTPEAADAAMKLGVNYPQGPFEWLARWSAAEVLALLDALDTHYRGERYRASPWLQRAAVAA